MSAYQYRDYHPINGNNFYRVRSVNHQGIVQYSNCVKVENTVTVEVKTPEKKPEGREGISIFPNPAKPGNLNLKINGLQQGVYHITLLNSFGKEIMKQLFDFKGGSSIQRILIPATIPAGIYYLEIIHPDNQKKVISIVF